MERIPGPGAIEGALLKALSTGADFAEIFLEDRRAPPLACPEGAVRGATSLHLRGAGIQLLKGASSAYAPSSDASPEGLLRLARRAAELRPSGLD